MTDLSFVNLSIDDFFSNCNAYLNNCDCMYCSTIRDPYHTDNYTLDDCMYCDHFNVSRET
jgi:hypothetical protein